MTEQEVRDFLAQFDEASKRLDDWPKWMREAAYVASASFPRMQQSQQELRQCAVKAAN